MFIYVSSKNILEAKNMRIIIIIVNLNYAYAL